MKKATSYNSRRPLIKLFFRNYAVISSLIIAAIVISLYGTNIVMKHIYQLDVSRINGADIYRYPFDKISGKLLEKYGGWFEIIDENGKVIFVKGKKEDDIAHYQNGQVYAKMDIERNDDDIAYHAFQAEGPHGESYVLLWKIPEPFALSTLLSLFVLFFAILLCISLYLYARYSVRQVKKPLRKILDGIREMERFNYRQRLDYTAEAEFLEIQDAFNSLAERLQCTFAEKEAAENNKRNLLLHLSHDLKTPITSIYGYSQLLLEKGAYAERDMHKYIQYIHNKSSYMAKLIQNLFELAKLDDRQMELKKKSVNITKWFQQLMVELYPEIEEKCFKLEAHIPEEPIFAEIDKIHMSRVITNLISNALQYNPSETVLYVACDYDQIEGNVNLLIADNGLGIPESIRANIFEAFIQGDTRVKESTGLGLAICKKIMMLHEGTIELVEDQQYATMFRICLPLQDLS